MASRVEARDSSSVSHSGKGGIDSTSEKKIEGGYRNRNHYSALQILTILLQVLEAETLNATVVQGFAESLKQSLKTEDPRLVWTTAVQPFILVEGILLRRFCKTLYINVRY